MATVTGKNARGGIKKVGLNTKDASGNFVMQATPKKVGSYTTVTGEKKTLIEDPRTKVRSSVTSTVPSTTSPTAPKTEPILITSGQGERVMNQTQNKIDNLKGTSITPEEQASFKEQLATAQTKLNDFLASTKNGTETATDTTKQPEESVTYINPETDQTVTLKGPAVTEENKKKYESQGYQPSEVTSTKATVTPLDTARAEMTTAASELNGKIGQLTNTAISSKELASKVRDITQRYSARMDAMRQINERRAQTMNTLGIRLGSRFTGSAAGTTGSILAEEERQGIERIVAIESDMQEAILNAEDAARNYNFTLYKELAQKAQDKYDEKKQAFAELEKIQKEEDAKIEADKTLIEQQTAAIEQITGGEKDPMKIFAALGGTVPFDVIKNLTDTLPNNKPVTLGKSETLVDPITGKVIARGMGEAPSGITPGVVTGVQANAIQDALNGMKFPSVDATKRAQAAVSAKLQAGDIEGAKNLIMQYAKNSFGETTGQVVIGYQQGLENLDTIEKGLANLEAKGIDTNIFSGIAQGIATKLGEAELKGMGDPALARQANDIALAIIAFRKAVSGAAFTESEGKAYEEVFPSIGKSGELNAQKIASLRDNFNNSIDSYLKFRINGYDEIFGGAGSIDYSSQNNDDLLYGPTEEGSQGLEDPNGIYQ